MSDARRLRLHSGFLLCGFSTPLTAALAPWLSVRYKLSTAELATYFLLQFVASVATAGVSSRAPLASMRIGFVLLCGFILLPVSHTASLFGATLVGCGLGLISPATNSIGANSEHAHELMSLNFVWTVGAVLISLTLLDVTKFAALTIALLTIASMVHAIWWWKGGVSLPAARKRVGASWSIELLFAASLFFYVGAETSVSSWSKLTVGAGGLSALWVGILLGRLFAPLAISRAWVSERSLLQAGLVSSAALLGCIATFHAVRQWPVMLIIGFALGPLFPLIVFVFSRRIPSERQWAFLTCGIGAATLPWCMGKLTPQYALSSTYVIPCAALVLTLALCASIRRPGSV